MIISICCKCRRILKVKAIFSLKDWGISHGYCQEYLRAEMAQWEELRRNERRDRKDKYKMERDINDIFGIKK